MTLPTPAPMTPALMTPALMAPASPVTTARPRSRRRPLALITFLTLGGLAAFPVAASAHVTVHADSTASASFSQLTFRVPTESDTVSTVRVQVQLPTDRPLLYVSTKPVAGWTAKTVEAKLAEPVESYGTTITKAVRTVTWTADSAASAIAPGEYQEFSVAAGPLPGSGDVLLPATQTYSDGTVVAWNEPPQANGEEPEHPAPVLNVTAADQPASSPTPAESAPTQNAPTQNASAGGGTDGTARGLGIAGLLVGAAGAGVAAVALTRSRSRPSA